MKLTNLAQAQEFIEKNNIRHPKSENFQQSPTNVMLEFEQTFSKVNASLHSPTEYSKSNTIFEKSSSNSTKAKYSALKIIY